VVSQTIISLLSCFARYSGLNKWVQSPVEL
jgi:hypothetical protein